MFLSQHSIAQTRTIDFLPVTTSCPPLNWGLIPLVKTAKWLAKMMLPSRILAHSWMSYKWTFQHMVLYSKGWFAATISLQNTVTVAEGLFSVRLELPVGPFHNSPVRQREPCIFLVWSRGFLKRNVVHLPRVPFSALCFTAWGWGRYKVGLESLCLSDSSSFLLQPVLQTCCSCSTQDFPLW